MSGTFDGDEEKIEERSPKRPRRQKKSTRAEREAFSQKNRSLVTREREARRLIKQFHIREETPSDIYGVGLDHPSEKPPCGIVFAEGDDRGRDCLVNYRPGNLMGPPLPIPKDYPEFPNEPRYRRQIGEETETLIELSYIQVVKKYMRLYLDTKRQENIARSQEPLRQTQSKGYIVKLRNFVLFAFNVLRTLPDITLTNEDDEDEDDDDYEEKEKIFRRRSYLKMVPNPMFTWGRFWRENTQRAIVDLNEYISELDEYDPRMHGLPEWPKKQSPELLWRKRFFKYYKMKDQSEKTIQRDEAEKKLAQITDAGAEIGSKMRTINKFPKDIRITRVKNLQDENILMLLVNRKKDENEVMNYLLEREEAREDFIEKREVYYIERDTFIYNIEDSLTKTLDALINSNWYVYRDPQLYARMYAVFMEMLRVSYVLDPKGEMYIPPPENYDIIDAFDYVLDIFPEVPQDEQGIETPRKKTLLYSLSPFPSPSTAPSTPTSSIITTPLSSSTLSSSLSLSMISFDATSSSQFSTPVSSRSSSSSVSFEESDVSSSIFMTPENLQSSVPSFTSLSSSLFSDPTQSPLPPLSPIRSSETPPPQSSSSSSLLSEESVTEELYPYKGWGAILRRHARYPVDIEYPPEDEVQRFLDRIYWQVG